MRIVKTVWMFSLLLVLFLHTNVMSQSEGDISSKMLNDFKSVLMNDKDLKPIMNAVSNNELNAIALNRDAVGRIDHYFNVRIDSVDKIVITNQKSSGRCWLFTGLNVLRLEVVKKYKLDNFEFSETYSFFYDQLEKANLFLEGVIDSRNLDMDDRKVEWLFKHPVGDGGVWNMAVALIEKYGLIPKNAMPETYHSENTRSMSRLIRSRLRKGGIKLRKMAKDRKSITELREEKTRILEDVYKVLALSLGTPPDTFVWRYRDKENNIQQSKIMTPLQFAAEVIDGSLQNYVMLMNDPSREYYKLYEIEYDRNMQGEPNWTYINLPTEKLKKYARNSLINNHAMYFSCDVGKQLNRDEGILSLENYDYQAAYGIDLGMSKTERIQTFDSGSSHAMTLVGVDTTKSGATDKWLLENSWGPEKGHKGYLTMTDSWFDAYMFRLVVKKEYIPDDILKILDQKPVKLRPWDPMFIPYEDQ